MKKYPQLSLKIRIFLFFFGILSTMILLSTLFFYHFISKSTFTKINQEYETMAQELKETSQNLIWKLTLTSQQLLENEEVQSTLTAYLQANDIYEKQHQYSNLSQIVTTLTMAEIDIALFYFYDPVQNEIIYANLPVKQPELASEYLYENSIFHFRGPIKSQCHLVGNPVFILDRKTILPNGNPIQFSVESGYYSLDRILQTLEDKFAYVIFTNAENDIVYSSFPETENASSKLLTILNGTASDFHIFSQQSSQGWNIYLAVPHTAYTSYYQNEFHIFFLFLVFLAFEVFIFALWFWRSIYHPLQDFDHHLELVLTDDRSLEQTHSSIPEFDYLFQKIALLQKQVHEMLEQTILQEKENTKIQLEKLRAQINPHFLLNTLNTVHWLALMNQQTEIDQITQALSHLLSYNLDKDSYHTNLQKELNAVQEYIRLQQIRYQFTYTTSIEPADSLLTYPCPKFILQPLIENSLSHGYREQMEISIRITVCEETVKLLISDTGTGMSADQLQKVRNLFAQTYSCSEKALVSVSQKEYSGKGIGLLYVAGILHLYYSENSHLEVTSALDCGTQILIELPKLKG